MWEHMERASGGAFRGLGPGRPQHLVQGADLEGVQWPDRCRGEWQGLWLLGWAAGLLGVVTAM